MIATSNLKLYIIDSITKLLIKTKYVFICENFTLHKYNATMLFYTFLEISEKKKYRIDGVILIIIVLIKIEG